MEFFFYRQIFCDFGDEFEVLDTTGENPLQQIVTEISHVSTDWQYELLYLCLVFQDEYGIVFMSTETRHGFEDGSIVSFQDVQGMTEVNDKEFKITVTSEYR